MLPLPHGLMDDDEPTVSQLFLDHAHAEWKAEMQLDRVADDLRREVVAGVAGGGRCRHPVRLRDPARPGKPPTWRCRHERLL
jgi:hypothetical protein